eukprot:m.85783 g.85783  ORF g.85783 m.85783 type:complete len:82 (-) comp12786_c1_seq1:167-412(-)
MCDTNIHLRRLPNHFPTINTSSISTTPAHSVWLLPALTAPARVCKDCALTSLAFCAYTVSTCTWRVNAHTHTHTTKKQKKS